MNRSFPSSGGKKGNFYFDKPHMSDKLYKKDNKIHQYMNLPIEEKNTIEPLKPLMQAALKMDIGEYKLERKN
jgi:hypothetical protein